MASEGEQGKKRKRKAPFPQAGETSLVLLAEGPRFLYIVQTPWGCSVRSPREQGAEGGAWRCQREAALYR